VAGTISAAVDAERSFAVTQPPLPRESAQQGTVEQISSDSGTSIPPAETRFVPGFTTSAGRTAAVPRGRISWIWVSDTPQRSGQTSVCMADTQEGRPA